MKGSDQKGEGKKKVDEITTFAVPFTLGEIKSNITINTNTPSKPSKEQIINQAIQFHLKGNIREASKCYQYCINQGFKDYRVFSNYGTISQSLGKLQEAEFSYRKAIEIQPDNAQAHYNLGIILKDQGNLKNAELSYRKAIEIQPDYAFAYLNLGNVLVDIGNLEGAELSYRKAIELNPDLTMVYYTLSKFQKSNNEKEYKKQIFSQNILNNKIAADKVNIYFARANILHKEKNYIESAKYLQLANKLKISLKRSNSDILINKSQVLLLESNQEHENEQENEYTPQSIFIVGMPRSGSTLVESILSRNSNINDLGEINILEESFLKQKTSDKKLSLAVLYWNNVTNHKSELKITTNKWLYNYQYAGIIARHIPKAKIIHCYRNPLDNLLSIYRTHFATGYEYSSSLTDCAKVYLDQEKIMTEYKKKFRAKIYDLNYDLLVSNPTQEIKELISWVGWKWNDSYLSPHLNPRSVSTASNVQVRSPISSKSIGGWKNYKEMLKPAIEILAKTDKYKNIDS